RTCARRGAPIWISISLISPRGEANTVPVIVAELWRSKMSFRSALILSSVLAAWSAAATTETIKIGVTPGPHAQIFEAVKPIAAKHGLDIQLIEFSDYVVPNAALD